MLQRLWLLFAQAVTVLLAWVFIVATLRPDWLPTRWMHVPEPSTRALPATGAGPERRDGSIVSYGDAAARAIPSVVNIYTTKQARGPQGATPFGDELLRRFFGEPSRRGPQAASLGSGVIVSPDGLVLTNHHVVEQADEIEVLLSDGRRTRARLVGSDPDTDLAVLRTELGQLPAIAFGSSDAARVGDVVLAIGNPFGVGQTVTMGIVSALGRNQLGINTFENFIQTDAAINPGNSGGALVDAQGRLLGINTAIYSRTGGSLGIGFAIPVSTARQVMDQIVTQGSVVRGYIGVEPQDVTPELAQAFGLPRKDGAIIAGLVRGGPADRAGVKPGDILIEVEGKPVTNTATMLNLVAQLKPENAARFRFVREGKDLDVQIVVGRRPTPQRGPAAPPGR